MIDINPQEATDEEWEEATKKFAEDFSNALVKAFCETEASFAVPFTSIRVGKNRYRIEGPAGTVQVIEIRISWR